MNRGQLAHLVWALALLGATPAWADSALPTASKRPLPHPDILSLPVEKAASPETPATATSNVPPAVSVAAQPAGSPLATDTPENKELAPRANTTSNTARAGENQELKRGGAVGKSSLLRDLWPLLAVLALIAGIVFFLKKYMPVRRMLAGSQVLQIVARTHVSAKQQLMLVKLGRKMVLIGVSPERIQTVATVDDPDQVALLMGDIASQSPRSMSRAFVESMEDESEAYIELPVSDPTSATQGQLHGLLHKVRTLSGKTE